MIIAVRIFSLAAVFIAGGLFVVSNMPNAPAWILYSAFGLAAIGGGFTGIIDAAQYRAAKGK